MADIFNFKQFAVNQSGCAMKVNTDGVLLGALAGADAPLRIMDIGTGTGVIALMLAQRFVKADVDAVEIDIAAAQTARDNFKASQFSDRMELHAMRFEDYFEANAERKYDLIVSNPPFFLNALASPGATRNLARHTNEAFFERLVTCISLHQTDTGSAVMILPPETANFVKVLLPECGLYLQSVINIKSFVTSVPHRELITIGREQNITDETDFVIYDTPKVYSEEYKKALQAFLTIF